MHPQAPESFDTTSARFVAVSKLLASSLSEKRFSLYRSLDDAAAWRKAFEVLGCDAKAVIAKGEEAADKADFTPIPDELYLEFSRNGIRRNFEKCLMRKQLDFKAIVLAECAERKGRFINAMLKGIDGIFLSAKSWVLPAHDKGNTTLNNTCVHIDLGSSYTAAWLTEILQIFGNKIPAEFRAKMVSAILRHVAGPVIATVKGERPSDFWATYKNNWSAVCWACCVRTVLGLDLPREDKIAVASAAVVNVPAYFKSFAEDGISTEGYGYWNYGFLHYTLLAETLRIATGSKLDLLEDPLAKLAARGPVFTSMVHSVHPTFSDMSVEFSATPSPLLAWLDQRMGWKLNVEMPPMTPCDEIGALFAFHGSTNPVLHESLAGTVSKYGSFMPAAGIMISRAPNCSTPFALAIKGGHNDEEHNHNDVGSYCIFCGNDWLATDPGAEVYSSRTFSPQRYDSLLINSFGHNVPRLGDGVLQSTGSDFRGEVLDCRLSNDNDFYRLDLTKAYEFLSLVSLVRSVETVRIGKTDEFTIDDTFEYSRPENFETAVIIFGTAERKSNDTIIIHRYHGGDATIRIETSAPWIFSCTEIECTIKACNYPRPTRIAIKLADPTGSGFVRIAFSQLAG